MRAAVAALALLRAAAEECACSSCCQVSNRPPSLQVRSSSYMCAAAMDTSGSCPEQCQVNPAYAVATNMQGTEMDYNRFCFMHCQPPEHVSIGVSCTELTNEQIHALSTAGGNGDDPATLQTVDGDDFEAPEAGDAAALQQAEVEKAEKAAAAAEASRFPDRGEVLGKAAGQRAVAAGMEARIAEAEARSMKMLALSTDSLATARAHAHAVHDESASVRSSAVQAAIYAKSALRSLARAKEGLKEIQAAAEEAAVEAGKEAKVEMEQKADAAWAKVAAFRQKFWPKGAPPMAEAANRAAAPYNAGMQRAMGIRLAYSTRAQELSANAADLQKGAQILARQAAQYSAAGSSLAPGMLATSKSMLADALAVDDQAHQWQAAAADLTQQIPSYQVAGAAAAARAAALANPAGQPPVPVPP